MDLIGKARKIKLLVMDCDGVLTDGRLYFSANGEELKVFHVRDGQGLVSWHQAGFRSGIISGRNSPIVEIRGRQLGVEFIYQGREEKVGALNEIAASANLDLDEIAYIGDDVPDAAVITLAGLGVAVADAVDETKAAADFVTASRGGCGAVRELIDMIMAAKN